MECKLKIEINSKYNIGDTVQKYETINEYTDKIVCPLCGGKHFVDNPKYDPFSDDGYEDSKLECPHCDNSGYIKTNYITKRVLAQTIYYIESIRVNIKKDKSVEFIYGLLAKPELNDRHCRTYMCNACEIDLELIN